ncbi:hypothetical protein KUF89_01885 [Streptococcus equi subsp. zooepidemicus]|uniref:hypothetical protein n=1 Tax=Streptococcus equi TaxID=1336 RepID=UPI001E4F303D|nr:hypothetical protein [Streptococcus equi]MCD3380034.1 hypothetical protein [Streptococcus equi subsp. zooepidemicus]MCD3409301.1 hypothetical protein [Streptococcus equi subsp. zooepidemicus]MCD3464841.1 hypothetical protein [Streptococcus equi subsp. zooepidemicus]HEL0663261.1 hypothetical protein [Streptococcus equi subsp. zooepidemicus]HEL1205294.1 hypothetical protein [Streptococcus equi subsp. zooepidemicus]
MNELERYSILIGRIEYSDGTGSKGRPAMVIRFDNEVIKVLKITSKFQTKSDYIQKEYFEIIDWFKAGLKRPSWIDTVRYYEIDNNQHKFDIIGHLSERDKERFKLFILKKLGR